MSKHLIGPRERVIVAAVSGGPDSVYLLRKLAFGRNGTRVIAGHVNYGTRGRDSQGDQALVERIGKALRMETDILVMNREGRIRGPRSGGGRFPPGFEKKARDVRYQFLKALSEKVGAEAIALAHTADDQVETILMRVFEGAGISGLKGIPRESGGGIVRPILHVWKEDILEYLKEQKIPYRIDRSNLDVRFERNWVRHVLIPLLEKRYGKAVKKRILTLGERFRELDDYLEIEARKWIRRNVKPGQPPGGGGRIVGKVPSIYFPRTSYSGLPTVLRVRIIQRVCFDLLGLAPNERLLGAIDRTVQEGGPSARLKIGSGWELVNQYGLSSFVPPMGRPDRRLGGKESRRNPVRGELALKVEERGKVTPAQARRAAASGGREYFDAAGIRMPLSVRPLRAGDRIRPFGLDADKKAKEILIDRKVPKDERWGRPVVCDAEGNILWIPGVIRSAHAPVGPETKKTVLLKMEKLGRK
jgi:tRNA(Ile)-lysidine synthase